MTMTNILLIVTQDTKQEEAAFLRDCLEDAGCNVIHLDPSVRKTIGGAEISPEDVAAAAGTTLEDIRAIGHEGKIQGEYRATGVRPKFLDELKAHGFEIPSEYFDPAEPL